MTCSSGSRPGWLPCSRTTTSSCAVPSPLTVGERELIAAYVSGLNACAYCHGAHQIIAEVHGIDPATLEGLVNDPAGSGVEARLLPILAYVRKLTQTPSRMVDADATDVFEAGWSEEALFHAISICALFNFMNRIVEGCGVRTDERVQAEQRARHARTQGRTGHLRELRTAHRPELTVTRSVRNGTGGSVYSANPSIPAGEIETDSSISQVRRT